MKKKTQASKHPFKRLLLPIIVIGIGSGFIGMALVLLLRSIQHIAFGYDLTNITRYERFLEGVSQASSERRIVILTLCGIIAGGGWALLYLYGKQIIDVKQALKTNKPMPALSTISHALLQIITIALGSPLGREVAPREIGALFAQWYANRAALSQEEIKLLLACGAGSAFAAVYSVPLGGMFFIMEGLLKTYHWRILFSAGLSSALAVCITWECLGNELIYSIPPLSIDFSLFVWSLISAPIFGYCASLFASIAKQQSTNVIQGWKILPACLINFSLLGFAGVYFPALLGNGISAAQSAFTLPLTVGLTLSLLFLRSLFVWCSLRVGACGGLLTPAFANGALLGVILGIIWKQLWPSSCSLGAFAIVGATSFLAVSQQIPLTAIILMFEFTRVSFVFLLPVIPAVLLASYTGRLSR